MVIYIYGKCTLVCCISISANQKISTFATSVDPPPELPRPDPPPPMAFPPWV